MIDEGRGLLKSGDLLSAIRTGQISLGQHLQWLPPIVLNLTNLHTLDLSSNRLTSLPPEIGQLINLHTLDLSHGRLTSLPPEIGQLINLHTLDLSHGLDSLPPEIGQLINLHSLDLSSNQLTSLPPEIGQLINLHSLDLSSNQLTSLPPEVWQLTNLHTLDLSFCHLTSLPPEIGQLTNLHTLKLYYCDLTSLPPEVWQLTNLHTLDLNSNQLTSLPPEIGQLINLHSLDLSSNQLTSLPPEVWQLTNLHELNVSFLGSLPPEIGQLTNLHTLGLGGDLLTSLPPEIGQLINLQKLYLGGNPLTSLPPEIGQLTNLEFLQLYNSEFTSLPPEIGQLTSLGGLDLRSTRLTSLPPEIGQLTNLGGLDLGNSGLTSLPPEIGQLTSLGFLGLNYNRLTSLPSEIGQLANLHILDLGSNQLTSLPPEIGQLTSLRELYLGGNPLTSLPPEIEQLTSLEVLIADTSKLNSLSPEIERLIHSSFAMHGPRDLEDEADGQAGAVDNGMDTSDVYPRVEAPGVVVVGEEFAVTIGIGSVAVEGVAGESFAVSDQPFTLAAQIIANGLHLADGQSWRQELSVTRMQPFPSVVLRLVADPQDGPVRASQIQVVYEVEGRVVGFGVRAIAIVDSAELLDGVIVDLEDEVTAVSIVAQGEPVADLTVSIVYGDAPGKLLWTYQSPHVIPPDEPDACDLGTDARNFGQMLIRQVHQREGRPDLDPFLRGTGKQIADKMPDGFWSLLADVAGATSPRRPTVLLQSAEPYVPWELAFVPTPLDPELPSYLGCQVVAGRWVLARRKPRLPPPLEGEADTMAVVTGVYDLPRWPRLPHAEEEAQILQATYAAWPVDADLPSVLGFLGADSLADLVHFAVHGSADPNGIENGIILVDGSALSPTVIQSYSLQGQPFVFLNACQLGTGQEVLGDYGGMAQAFLYAEACGVVAPLWSVNDNVAKDLVVDFYARILTGERPAEVLRDLRCKAGSGTGPAVASALAYQFFGHPSMTLNQDTMAAHGDGVRTMEGAQ